MIQTISLTPSAARLALDPWFAGSSIVLTGTVPASPSLTVWSMQLWASQWALIEDVTATPLATAIGSVASGTLTVGFTPTQTADLDLTPVVGNNSFWLVIGGQDANGEQQIIRAGTIEISPCPWSSTSLSNSVGITVTNDVASFVYDGVTYTFPVAEVGSPPVTPDGIAISDDNAYFDFDGEYFQAPASEIATPPEAIEGELVVINDTLIVLLSGVAYSIPVQVAS